MKIVFMPFRSDDRFVNLAEDMPPGVIFAVAMGDVAEAEPLDPDSELWHLDNVLISPHVACGGNRGGYKRFRDLFLSNLECFRAGKPIPFAIDWEKEAAEMKAGG